MQLSTPGAPHLTYCTNIHAGESWTEVRASLSEHVLAVKAKVAPDRPFGVGLRLSAAAAGELCEPSVLEELRAFLAANGLYVFTINGFPYGSFHGMAIKERVYLPDWLEDERLSYTDRLALLLAEILPADADLEGSVSTVPGAFKPRIRSPADEEAMAARLLRHVALLHRIRERTGKTIALALEPEPFCHLETIAETVAFFERHVFAGRLPGLPAHESEATLRRHIGVCFDACHMAVEYEEPAAALGALDAAGIRVAKIQISAGLEVALSGADTEALDELRAFADAVYLHQVVERGATGLTRYLDLPDALAAAAERGAPCEWRIHFHVPIFLETLGRFRSTQRYLCELLDLVREAPRARHLEVETYTWDVLPEEHRQQSVSAAVARELRFVLDRLAR